MPQDEEVTIRVWQEELFWKALILVIITIFEISLVIALPYMDWFITIIIIFEISKFIALPYVD